MVLRTGRKADIAALGSLTRVELMKFAVEQDHVVIVCQKQAESQASAPLRARIPTSTTLEVNERTL